MVNNKKVNEVGTRVSQLLSECASRSPNASIKANFIEVIDVTKRAFNIMDWRPALYAIFSLETVQRSLKELHSESRQILKARLSLLVPDINDIIE
jgi:hypothetical protein